MQQKKNYSNIKNENMEFLSKTTYIVEEEKNGEKEDKTPENKNKKENENEKKRKNSKKKKKEIRYESSNLKIKLFKKKIARLPEKFNEEQIKNFRK